jgi:hypothetical protein
MILYAPSCPGPFASKMVNSAVKRKNLPILSKPEDLRKDLRRQ